MKKKLLALVCALALTVSLVGCALSTPDTVGKIGDFEVTSGLYLLAQYDAYQQAAQLAGSEQDTSKVNSFLKATITTDADTGDPPPSVSDLVNVSLVRVQAAAVGVYEVTQKKDTLILNLETLDLAMIRGLLQAFNGRVTAGAGTKPYLSVVLQPDEKPLELLQNILKAMADILTGTEREKAPPTGEAGTRKRD